MLHSIRYVPKILQLEQIKEKKLTSDTDVASHSNVLDSFLPGSGEAVDNNWGQHSLVFVQDLVHLPESIPLVKQHWFLKLACKLNLSRKNSHTIGIVKRLIIY